MTSRHVRTHEELHGMKRVDLQRLAKDYGIKGNLKTDTLIEQIVMASAGTASPSPRTQTSSLSTLSSRSRSGGQLSLDEQENQPEYKLKEESPAIQDSGSTKARNGIFPQSRLPIGRSRTPGGSMIGSGRSSSVKSFVPPGVVAAHPETDDRKGKSRTKSPRKLKGKRGTTDETVVARQTSVDDVKETDEKSMELVFINPSDVYSESDLPTPVPVSANQIVSYSDSAAVTMLETRVTKLEDAQEATNEAAAADIKSLQDQLKVAQDNIRALTKDNQMLKKRLDTFSSTTQDDMHTVLSRLVSLEEQFSRMKIKPTASASSSDAEMTFEAPQLAPRSEYYTPPNQIGNGRRISLALAPALSIKTDKTPANPSQISTAQKTPPPRTRRYSWNPDQSPSPTRPSTARRMIGFPAAAVPNAGTSGNASTSNNTSSASRAIFRSSTAFVPSGLIRRTSGSDLGEPTVQKRFRRESGTDESRRPPLGSDAPERHESTTPERPFYLEPSVAGIATTQNTAAKSTRKSTEVMDSDDNDGLEGRHFPLRQLPVPIIAAAPPPSPISSSVSAPSSLTITRPPSVFRRGAGSGRRLNRRNSRKSHPYSRYYDEAEAEVEVEAESSPVAKIEDEGDDEIDERDEDNDNNEEDQTDSHEKINLDDEDGNGGDDDEDEDEDIVPKKESTPGNSRGVKGGMRDIFGVTPDATKPPPPLFIDGALPILKLGGPSTFTRSASVSTSSSHSHLRSHSYAYGHTQSYTRPAVSASAVAFTATPGPDFSSTSTSTHTLEDVRGFDTTPTPTPTRELRRNPMETPPASRTLFGTEIGTALKAKFSDDPSSAWR